MAAITAIAAVVGTAIAAKSYSDSRKAAAAGKAAAKDQRMADNMTAQQTAQASVDAGRRDAAAREAEAALAQQEAALANTPDVTVDSAENNNVRRRRVQASFNVASGGASNSSGSVRL